MTTPEAPILRRVTLKRELPDGDYLKEIPAVRYLAEMEYLPLDKAVTLLVGENGTGKSTLLEGIAVAAGFNAEGGTRNFCFSTQETHSGLWQYLTLSRCGTMKDGFFLRAESFYNAASYIDRVYEGEIETAPYGGRSLHRQSHGESFLSLIQNRFTGGGLYLLDEPEAALSPMRQLTLMAEMGALVRKGAQFILATHSPPLMAYPDATVYLLSGEGIHPVDYTQTEHYQVTKAFLENPRRMLKILLE